VVDLAVDGDRGLFLEVVPEAWVEPVTGLHRAGFWPRSQFAHAAGVAPAEAGGEDDAAVIVLLLPLRRNPHPPGPSGLVPPLPRCGRECHPRTQSEDGG
jgi:hypothetical protein